MRRVGLHLVLLGTFAVLFASSLEAQRALHDSAGQVSFEVAWIKAANPNGVKSAGTGVPGQFAASSVTLHELIAMAYGGTTGRLGDDRLVDEPSWFSSQRWDLLGKASADEGMDRMLLMLQTLLRDRFGLHLALRHPERKVFALVPARRDRRPGADLKPSKIDCAKLLPEVEAKGRWPPGIEWCGWRYQPGDPVHVEARGVTLGELAARLEPSPSIQRPVVDRTGLQGTFDFTFTYSAQPASSDIDVERVSIFTALEEYLGLKLVADKAPVDVFAVVAAHPPDPD
jgi:uncharacterized protein (TIGR03435 family)